ncbi:MAG: glutathione S-transferase family protein [Proteobacteria bacterium]|nr:glutathione S-transferase family protein [Pseudomonadota bacterium]
MIILYQTPPAWGLASFSPFCLKVETYLRMTGLDYRAEVADVRQAPKGKIPWIDDAGTIVADSSAIIDYLKEHHGDPLDRRLDDSQRGAALATQRMIEEHTYFGMQYLRWMSQEGWPHLKTAFVPMVPKLVHGVIMSSIRKTVIKQCHAQGMGRHSKQEIIERITRDFKAASGMLGEQPFFLGDEPTSLDAIMYGFFPQVLDVPWESEEKAVLRSLPNLVSFCDRMNERYWSGDSGAAQ